MCIRDSLKSFLKEVTDANGEIILFIEELHTSVGAGASEGAVDAANLLKPALARGELRTLSLIHIWKTALSARNPAWVTELWRMEPSSPCPVLLGWKK